MAKNNRAIELYVNRDQVLNAAIDKMVVEILNRKQGEGSQKLLLSGCSPVAGTTSICIALSIAIAATGRKVLLVDCDVRKNIKYKKLNDVTENGLSNYLLANKNNTISEDDIVYRTNITNLEYVPCGMIQENPTRVLCSEKFPELIHYYEQNFDCIVFDFPSLAVVPDAQVLFGYMDGIALVAALGETKKRQIKDAKRIVADYADKYYGIIINKVEKADYKAAIKDYDYYFVDDNGNQNLTGSGANKKLKKMTGGRE